LFGEDHQFGINQIISRKKKKKKKLKRKWMSTKRFLNENQSGGVENIRITHAILSILMERLKIGLSVSSAFKSIPVYSQTLYQ